MSEKEQKIEKEQEIQGMELNQQQEAGAVQAEAGDGAEQTQNPEKEDKFIRHGNEEIVINLKSLKGKVARCKEKVSRNKEKIQQKSGGALSSWKEKIELIDHTMYYFKHIATYTASELLVYKLLESHVMVFMGKRGYN